MKTAISEEEPRVEEEDSTAVPVKVEAKRKLYTLTEDTVKTSIPAGGETEKQERLRKQREKQVRLVPFFSDNTMFSAGEISTREGT